MSTDRFASRRYLVTNSSTSGAAWGSDDLAAARRCAATIGGVVIDNGPAAEMKVRADRSALARYRMTHYHGAKVASMDNGPAHGPAVNPDPGFDRAALRRAAAIRPRTVSATACLTDRAFMRMLAHGAVVAPMFGLPVYGPAPALPSVASPFVR